MILQRWEGGGGNTREGTRRLEEVFANVDQTTSTLRTHSWGENEPHICFSLARTCTSTSFLIFSGLYCPMCRKLFAKLHQKYIANFNNLSWNTPLPKSSEDAVAGKALRQTSLGPIYSSTTESHSDQMAQGSQVSGIGSQKCSAAAVVRWNLKVWPTFWF